MAKKKRKNVSAETENAVVASASEETSVIDVAAIAAEITPADLGLSSEEAPAAEDFAAVEEREIAEETIALAEQILEDSPLAENSEAAEVVVGEDEQHLAEGEVFDESKLLELAQSEGLIDEAAPQDAASDEDEIEIDLPVERQAELMASMETILFMSDKPVGLPKLRSTIDTGVKLNVYRALMAKLRREFAADHRGIEVAEVSMGFQLRTKPHMAAVLRKMVKTQPLKLSNTTMEVLAIISYKQPLTKDEIDQIRGVDSGYVLRNLMEKRLVKIAGRSELPGKPMVYATTHEFLELFNLKDLSSLPPLHEVEAMVAASEVGFEEKTQAVMDEFGKMVANSTKILFDDSQIDDELEALRTEIASIPTSTWFIDYQKAKDKLQARLSELASQGLTLDAAGNEVPLDTVPADTAMQALEAKYAAIREAEERRAKEDPAEEQTQEQPAETVATETTEAGANSEATEPGESMSAEEQLADTAEAGTETESETQPEAEAEAEAVAEAQSDTEIGADIQNGLAEPIVTEPPLATSSAIIADTEVALQVNTVISDSDTEAAQSPVGEHSPSSELEAAAAEAQWERHAAMIAQAVTESAAETEIAVVNAEALADAVTEAKIEQELDAQDRAEREPEPTPEA